MSKFFGIVGFAEDTIETSPGVWVEKIVERNYYGDVNRNTRRLESSSTLNDNINLSNEISILADPYAYNHFHLIRYVEFMGTRWKVTTVEEKYPRLILVLGGLYNGEQA